MNGNFYWSNSLHWAPFLFRSNKDRHEAIRQMLLRNYTGIAAFHACRPTSLEPYRSEGLKYFDRDALEKFAVNMFSSFTALAPPDLVQAAIRNVDSGAIGVCLAIDDREVRRSHFASRGSEFCHRVAKELERTTGHDFPTLLAAIGKPALITVGLLWSDLDESRITEISFRVAEETAQDQFDSRVPPSYDGCFLFEHDVHAKRIVSLEQL